MCLVLPGPSPADEMTCFFQVPALTWDNISTVHMRTLINKYVFSLEKMGECGVFASCRIKHKACFQPSARGIQKVLHKSEVISWHQLTVCEWCKAENGGKLLLHYKFYGLFLGFEFVQIKTCVKSAHILEPLHMNSSHAAERSWSRATLG